MNKLITQDVDRRRRPVTTEGPTEHGLLLILIAVAIVAGIGLFENQIVSVFSQATSVLTGA